jgi:hypothetical protein
VNPTAEAPETRLLLMEICGCFSANVTFGTESQSNCAVRLPPEVNPRRWMNCQCGNTFQCAGSHLDLPRFGESVRASGSIALLDHPVQINAMCVVYLFHCN